MKAIISFLTILTCIIFLTFSADAQVLKRIKERAGQTASDKIVNKAGDATEKAMDRTEESVKKGNKKSTDTREDGIIILTGKEEKNTSTSPSSSLKNFKNFDFVPGDRIIYFYDMAGEADSEIPGRMLIHEGAAEVQTYKGEKVLFIPAGGSTSMSPLMKEGAYLPEQFTLEFDILSNGGLGTTTDASQITLYFREKDGRTGYATAPIKIELFGISGNDGGPQFAFGMFKNDEWIGGSTRNFPKEAEKPATNDWRHVSVYVNKNIGKLYLDQHRLGVVNQIESGAPAKLDIEIANDEHPVMIKNLRIAAGGADAYKKVMTDGKYIAYGIQFDVNKASLKPESMGTINEFVKMMKENAGLKFEIGGHTDADGTAERNQVLSAGRADVVKAQMVSLGIDAGRLTTKGYGSSKPVMPNDHAENKAKNRRVEFIKLQ